MQFKNNLGGHMIQGRTVTFTRESNCVTNIKNSFKERMKGQWLNAIQIVHEQCILISGMLFCGGIGSEELGEHVVGGGSQASHC